MDLTIAIQRFRGPLVGLIASWGTPHVDAAEIAQDCFVEAYLSQNNCRGDIDDTIVYGRWLRGIARNKFRNWYRARDRRLRHVIAMDPTVLDQLSAEYEPDFDPKIANLRHAIDRLPAKLRQAILMHYLEETSVNDVAALLSVTPKTIEGRLYQARKRLKVMLSPLSPASITKALPS